MIYIYLFLCLFSKLISEDYIEIEKKNVLHKFCSINPELDHFTSNIFLNWKNKNFEIFDQVKDPTAIAIDLGAWIGTTSIWLSKNFYAVIAVDADKNSLECLKKNLCASACSNVTVCDKPVFSVSKNLIFGPRGAKLNESISYIKEIQTNKNDYVIQSITFKELLQNYVFENENISSKKIGFIKCDIEGGEEYILEDLLDFVYDNNAKAYISFHLDWWTMKKIEDFEHLFRCFKTDCPDTDICQYLKTHPFESLLFESSKN